MPVSLIPSFLFYSLVAGITPGPANLCSFSAAVRYGKNSALRQWRGLFTGFAIISLSGAVLLFAVGNVVGEYVKYLKWVGAAYIVYLAFHMLYSSTGEVNAEGDCNFFTGLMVQLTNVKVMIFCLTALSAYVLPYTTHLLPLLMLGVILPFTGPVCNLVWIFAGDRLRSVFSAHEKAVNVTMAAALLICAVSIIR